MLLILLAGREQCPLMPVGDVWPWVQMLLSCRAASALGHHTSEAHLGTSVSLYTQLEEAEALNVIEMKTETPHRRHGDRLLFPNLLSECQGAPNLCPTSLPPPPNSITPCAW